MRELTLDCQQFISASFIFVTQLASRQRASSNWSWHPPNMKATNHTFLLGLISSLAPCRRQHNHGRCSNSCRLAACASPSISGLAEKNRRMARHQRQGWHLRLLGGFNALVRTCATHLKGLQHGWAVNKYYIWKHVWSHWILWQKKRGRPNLSQWISLLFELLPGSWVMFGKR